MFSFFEQLGIHVIVADHYSPIPRLRTLPKNIFQRKFSLKELQFDLIAQRRLLNKFSEKFKNEYKRFPLYKNSNSNNYYVYNGGFESVDGEILYGMIRYFKPRRVIEVGSGNSTLLISHALQENLLRIGQRSVFKSIDPNVTQIFQKTRPDNVIFYSKQIQSFALSFFRQLLRNDILFVDSSHVVNMGSDVSYLILEVLPNLKPGVIVHFHDIYFPFEYPQRLLKLRYFWNEQYMIHAFLSGNRNFEIIWSSSLMHSYYSEELSRKISSYRPKMDWPASLWLRKLR